MNCFKYRRISAVLLSAFLFLNTFFMLSSQVYAEPVTAEDFLAEAEDRKALPIQSNQIENWPAGPAIGAQSAILLEANTGVVLYAKNMDEKQYPASTTKLMTCLLAAENCDLDEIVTFSHDAVFSIESGSSNIGIDEGQSMPLEECLYGILVASANEVANAVAEHVAGSMDAFAEMMNEKAAELGCKNTRFVNAHGLYDESHYTSAYDLALIARAFFQNDQLAKIGNTASYHFEATATQPDDFIQRNKHKLITGEIPYEGIKGGKTGYTDEARQTLVTCAEQNGMKLICVIMKEESPDQFYDTVSLFDYGFANFSTANVSESETRYSIVDTNFFNTSSDIFGNSNPILTLNQDSYLILPKTADFEELDSQVSYDVDGENTIAKIDYYFHDTYVGCASVDLASKVPKTEDLALSPSQPFQASKEGNVIVVNVKYVLLIVVGIAVLLILIVVIHSVIVNYSFLNNTRDRKRRRRIRKDRKNGPHFPSSGFDNFDL